MKLNTKLLYGNAVFDQAAELLSGENAWRNVVPTPRGRDHRQPRPPAPPAHKSTSNFRPSDAAHLCSVASVGFSILDRFQSGQGCYIHFHELASAHSAQHLAPAQAARNFFPFFTNTALPKERRTFVYCR